MRNKFLNLKYLILLACLFQACETVVDVELDVDPLPVLNILLNEGEPFSAMLVESVPYHTIPLSKNEIKNASMTLNIEQNGVEEPMNYNPLSYDDSFFLPVDGLYECDIIPEYGKTYTIQAEIEGFKTITATTTFPEPTKILKADTSTYFGKIDPLDIDAPSENYLKIVVEIENSETGKKYYGIKTRNKNGFDPQFSVLFLNNQETELTGYRGLKMFNDETLKSGNIEILVDYKSLLYEIDPENGELPDLEVVFSTFSEDMFKYVKSAKQQSNNLGFFEELFFEPINVYTNVQNGLGIFAGMSTDTLLIEF